jgi:hypothetical protein
MTMKLLAPKLRDINIIAFCLTGGESTLRDEYRQSAACSVRKMAAAQLWSCLPFHTFEYLLHFVP